MIVGCRWTRAAIVLGAVLMAPAGAIAQMSCEPCTVGVVLDGPWERNDEVRGVFEAEVLALVGDDLSVQFPEDKRRVADSSLTGVSSAVDALMGDQEVDVILTMGPVASTYAARLDTFPKPVVAVFVIDPETQGIPIVTTDQGERVSGVPNLNYVMFPSDIQRDVQRLRELTPFRRLVLLTSSGLAEAVPELEANLVNLAQGLDLDVSTVRVGASVTAAIDAIPEDADAVYVYPLMQLPPGDFGLLVQGLIERRLPSFSYWGRDEVELGLLASLYATEAFDRLGRRIALNTQRILLGEDAGSLPVDFDRRVRFSLNAATARAVGVYPSWSVWTEAEILGDDEQTVERLLTLPIVAREAVTANLALLAARRSVAAADYDRRVARSVLYPRLSVASVGELIDSDRAASFSGGPERLGVASASVSQLLYSDGARANVSIQDELQLSRVQQLEQTRLDVVLDATVAYLDVLRAKTFEDIQIENLSITRSNLDLAQVRQDLGVARPAEVIRWENEIANNRRNVINASAQRNIAEMQVNRLLHRSLEEPFETDETRLDDPVFQINATRLRPYIGNPFSFDVFRDFMATEALGAAPELRQIDAAIRAQERALVAAGRVFWSPTVSFNGDVSTVTTGGAGSSFSGGLSLPPGSITVPNAINWTLNLSASLPLFEGGARRAERAQTSEELEELLLTRQALVQQIEQRVRAALHAAGASHAGIELAEASANAAERNLALVTDAYQQGAASILDLLDAQTQTVVAREVAASASFDYLIDFMRVQRAVGRFDFFVTPGDVQAFFDRLNAFFERAGSEPALAN